MKIFVIIVLIGIISAVQKDDTKERESLQEIESQEKTQDDLEDYENKLENELLKTLQAERENTKIDQNNKEHDDDDDDDEEELAEYDESDELQDPWFFRRSKPHSQIVHHKHGKVKARPLKSRTSQVRRRWRWRKILEHGKKIYHKVRPSMPYFAHALKLLVGKKKREEERKREMLERMNDINE